MRDLPDNLVLEKNKLEGDNPWLILLDIYVDAYTTLYLVRNNEDIVFQTNTYVAFPFEIEASVQKSKGELPTIGLKVGNVTRAIQAHLEATDGLIGNEVTLRVVNSAYLSENYAELTETFEILNCVADAMWVNMTLGFPNPMSRRFPLYRYLAEHCRYVGHFKSKECGYTGADTTCSGTLTACRLKGNSERFGGFPGLGKGGIRIA